MFDSLSPLIDKRRIAHWAHDEALSLAENRSLTDPAEIEQALRFGEYIKNGTHVHTHTVHFIYIYMFAWMACKIIETLALYSLRKYRYLKQRYDRDT